MANLGPLLAAALTLSCTAGIGVQPVLSAPSDPEIRQLLVERIGTRESGVGIVAGVVEPAVRRVVGHGRLGSADPREPDSETVFEIGSIIEAFTAILLADMVTRGEVHLDAPAQSLLGPDVRMPTRNEAEISLRHLATHG